MARRSMDATAFASALAGESINIYTLAGRSGIALWKIRSLLRKAFTPSLFIRKAIYTALSSTDNTIFPVVT